MWYGAGMSAIEFAGVEFTFSQLSGEAKVFEWEFLRDGRPMDVAGVVFSGVVVDADEAVVGDVVCEHVSEVEGVIRVRFPRLEVGTYDFEVRYQGATGDMGRVVFGRIGVEASALVLEEFFGEERDRQRLALNVPKEAGGQLVLEWKAGSIGSAAAERALEAAEKLLGLDATLERLEAQVEEFRVFVANWHDSVRSVLVMNPVTGTIWVGGVDTGQPYRGEDGKAPRVNAYGNWETFDGQRWRDIGVRAYGRDGRDGDQVRRLLAGSAEEVLAKPEERGVYYFVPAGDGYDVWCWLEAAGWVCVGREAYGVADVDSLGLVMLGTDAPVVDGAPVGVKGLQLHVPSMTTSVAGSAKVSTSSEMSVARKDGIIGKNADGQLMARRARPGQAGVMEPSRTDGLARVLAVGIVPDGTMVDGIDRSGQTGCTRAQADTYGMVKVAFVSTNEACNDIEWNVPVGIRDDMTEPVQGTTDSWYRGANGMLYIPLSAGGCLQWVSSGVQRKDGKQWSTGGVLKLRHSGQFGVGNQGLELLTATGERVAGVRFSRGPEDDADGSVLRAADTARRDDVYDKTAADERFMSTQGGCVAVKVCKEGTLPPADEQEKGVLYIGL